MKENEFKCAMCGNIYEKGWSDEESAAEYANNFGEDVVKVDKSVVICDDCYQLVNPVNHPDKVAETREILGL